MAWHQRLRKEAHDLEEKLSRLLKFIQNNPEFDDLEEKDQALMGAQAAAMTTYLAFLSLRIERYEEEDQQDG